MEEICRVIRSKEQAKTAYDRLSKWYDLLAGNFEKKAREIALTKLNVQEGEKVLEIGFGTGHCILSIAQSVGKNGKVYGLDISEGMLNVTASRVKEAGLSERVNLQCGDASNLPYADNFFDAVFMSFTLELFDTPDIPIVLQQCRRVLKNGGRVCIVALSKEGKAGAIVKLYEWLHRKFPNYADCRPIYVRQSLEKINFEIVDTTIMYLWKFPGEIVLAKK